MYIEESNSMADVTFPSLPHVVSLLHYDDVRRTTHNASPPAGYPVVCVTVCLSVLSRAVYELYKDVHYSYCVVLN